MCAKTLKTVVQKTVTVAGLKLGTPAERFGLGFVMAMPTSYSTDNLSRGENPFSPNPESESVRSRQLSAMQMQHTDDPAVQPASSVGCLSAPGQSADGFMFAITQPQKWQASSPTTAKKFADRSRAAVSGDLCLGDQLGSDCQSPAWSTGLWILRRKASPIRAAEK
jgi:hypothetical protein